jgi:hypothetical protein
VRIVFVCASTLRGVLTPRNAPLQENLVKPRNRPDCLNSLLLLQI